MATEKYFKDCLTIPDFLNATYNHHPDQLALQIKRGKEYEQLTYADFKERVDLIGAALVENGFKPGDKAAVIGENRPEWAISYLAIQSAGGIVVPLDAQLKQQEMFHIMFDSGASFLFASEKFLSDISEIKSNLTALKKVISMGEDETYKDECGFWDTFLTVGKKALEAGSNDYLERTHSEDDLAVIIYTSGTTGQAKGVMLTHKNIVTDVKGVAEAIYFDENDNFISILPLHHTFEATGGFIVPISRGCTISYAPSLKSKEIVDTIKSAKCTIMLGVPLLYEKIMLGMRRSISQKPLKTRVLFGTSLNVVKAAKKVLKKDLGEKVFAGLRQKAGMETIRLMVSGGAALSPDVGDGFRELGFNLIQGYGLTETSPVITINPVDKPITASAGKALPGCEVKIDQPNSEGIGEIIARGPMIMKGYFNNQEATDEIIRDGWFYTGDLGYFDNEGYLYISGRSKNLIVSKAGKNIYPEEVEYELSKSPFILEALVLGRMIGDREEVHAIVVPDSEYFDTYAKDHDIALNENKVKEILKKEIGEYCTGLADYKRVKDFAVREEEFPKSSTKKIKRYLFTQKSAVKV